MRIFSTRAAMSRSRTASGGLVVVAPPQLVRQVLLGSDAHLEVVRIDVALAVAEPLRARVMRVAEVRGHTAESPGTHVGDRRVDREVGGVGLGRRREIGGGLRERDTALGHADEGDGVGGGDRDDQRLRVGEADVLGCRDHETPGDEARVLPRLDHPRQIVHGGIDVGASDRLDERTDDVVVLIPLAVVAQQSAVDGVGDVGRCDGRAPVAIGIVVDDHGRRRFERSERAACVAGSQLDERRACLGIQDHGPIQPASIRHRAIEQEAEIVVGERLQGQ